MTPSDPDQSHPEQRPAKGKKKIRFFNVSLRNGIVVSTPSYQEKQVFCSQLIRTIETANPDFAWVQFLFVRSSYGADLVRLKNSMRRAKTAIEQPALDLISGQEHERRELRGDYYNRADAGMKKIDDMVAKPAVTLAIQGIWVGEGGSSPTVLPFDHCADEHDCLAVFEYRDPRMLLELVNRKMVEDISEYLDRYTKSRLEPPSFIVTPEELRSYIHLPAGERIASLRSVNWETSKREFSKGKVGGGDPEYSGGPPEVPATVVRIAKVPSTKKVLDDSIVQPFDHIASTTVRTFEVAYCGGKTELILSARTLDDMGRYAGLLNQVYGELELEKANSRPAFLEQLSRIVGLTV
jgi:hypothetical protein